MRTGATRSMGGKCLTHLLIHDVQSGLVDQPNVQALLPAPQNRVPTPIQHLSERHHVSSSAFGDDLVLTRYELVIPFEETRAVLLEDPRDFRSGGEHEADSALKEDALDNRDHLASISGEI